MSLSFTGFAPPFIKQGDLRGNYRGDRESKNPILLEKKKLSEWSSFFIRKV